MKHILASILAILISLPTIANDGKDLFNVEKNSSINNSFFDPGHKQRNNRLNKDHSPIELYFGATPSFAIKLNSYGGDKKGLTESLYFMTSMDLNDQDLHAKIGIGLNPTKYNQNRSLSNPKMGWFKLWRYQMLRHSLEIGYKTHFLDPENDTKEKLVSTNYGGLTVGYTIIADGMGLFDRTLWYGFDMRTARRLRLKLDIGFFFNFDKFDQAHLGFLSASNNTNGTDFNEDVPDDSGSDDFDSENYNPNFGQPLEMATYPVFSPFVNLSIGIALW